MCVFITLNLSHSINPDLCIVGACLSAIGEAHDRYKVEFLMSLKYLHLGETALLELYLTD